MYIGGLQKTSLIDYPDKISCILFTIGCNLRCPYCHNSDLVIDVNETPSISNNYFFDFLSSRRDFLDAVVITGGEPLLQRDIVLFIEKIKSLGFFVKLDTNGTFPHVLKELINNKLVDYIAMDIKTSTDKYEQACGAKVDMEKIEESIETIMNYGGDYEFRTTALPEMQTPDDFIKIGKWLRGAKRYYIQNCSNRNTLDVKFAKASPYSDKELKNICGSLHRYFNHCEVRG
jgi:pyruvate formate lyase activating enzyme